MFADGKIASPCRRRLNISLGLKRYAQLPSPKTRNRKVSMNVDDEGGRKHISFAHQDESRSPAAKPWPFVVCFPGKRREQSLRLSVKVVLDSFDMTRYGHGL